jgi:hypothetical protein
VPSVQSEEDLYLPCGVRSLTSLRQSMIIEEVTLGALARARASARDQATSRILCQAQAARSARLVELRTTAARIATIGEYYKLRARSTRATLGLPAVAAQALRAWADSQAGERVAAGDDWQDTGLVFTNHLGAALDAGNVRKMFKRICTGAGVGDGWTPRELRTTFVSLLSHRGGQHRGDRPAGRARLHPDHRGRLPAGTAASNHHRRRDHGRALQRNLAPCQSESRRPAPAGRRS